MPKHLDETLLLTAISGNTSDIMKLVLKGADVNCADKDRLSPLHWACHAIRLDNIKTLISQGANVNAVAKDGKTPLSSLCRSKKKDPKGLDAIQFLIQHGANINYANINHNPLVVAFRENNLDRFKALLDYNPKLVFPKHNINIYKTVKNYTDFIDVLDKHINKELHAELFSAIRNGNVEAIKRLVSEGANMDHQNPDDDLITPLITAITHDQVDSFTTLLELGADQHLANAMNRSPFFHACMSYHKNDTRIYDRLAALNPVVNEQDSRGNTVAMKYYTNDDLFRRLLEFDIDLELKNDKGKTLSAILVGPHSEKIDMIRSSIENRKLISHIATSGEAKSLAF